MCVIGTPEATAFWFLRVVRVLLLCTCVYDGTIAPRRHCCRAMVRGSWKSNDSTDNQSSKVFHRIEVRNQDNTTDEFKT